MWNPSASVFLYTGHVFHPTSLCHKLIRLDPSIQILRLTPGQTPASVPTSETDALHFDVFPGDTFKSSKEFSPG